jgi:hypothetical protein
LPSFQKAFTSILSTALDLRKKEVPKQPRAAGGRTWSQRSQRHSTQFQQRSKTCRRDQAKTINKYTEIPAESDRAANGQQVIAKYAKSKIIFEEEGIEMTI